jgi:hypothetical protein
MFRIGLAASVFMALVAFSGRAFAQEAPGQGHLERCKTWTVENGRWGATNTCEQTVVVHLIVPNIGLERTWTLTQGQRLVTDLPARPQGWMATTCALGYEPSVPFDWDNHRAEIIASAYHCVKH